ncbi:hypothetical protein Tco_0056952, partial [Tanacetum coccineum]
MVKVKENALDVEIQIISSENVQCGQEAITKKLSMEEHGVIVAKMRKKRQPSNEICLGINLEPGEWIKDSGCSKHMTGNRKLFSTYKAYNGGNVIFGSNLRGNIIGK